jgi:hypothetical protein
VPAQISVTRTPRLSDARIVDGYALVFAAVLRTGGALGDTLGVRRVFVFAANNRDR